VLGIVAPTYTTTRSRFANLASLRFFGLLDWMIIRNRLSVIAGHLKQWQPVQELDSSRSISRGFVTGKEATRNANDVVIVWCVLDDDFVRFPCFCLCVSSYYSLSFTTSFLVRYERQLARRRASLLTCTGRSSSRTSFRLS
jgi:hypothetical protein